MIKQTWVVNEEEKRRILSLHENATKRQYLMKEQVSEQWSYREKEMNKATKDAQSQIETETQSLTKNNVPKNIRFSFPLKKLNNPAVLQCVTNDVGDVFVYFNEEPHKLPTIQEIGLPKFWFNDDGFLEGTDDWEWVNDLNDFLLTRNSQNRNLYIPSYDKSDMSLHFLYYDLEQISKRDAKKLKEAEDFLQANDSKYVSFNDMFLVVGGDDLPLGINLDLSEPVTPVEKPKEKTIKLNITSPFVFDSTELTDVAKPVFENFIKDIIDNYSGVTANVEVITSSSVDGDPTEKLKNGMTRGNYDMDLSQRRAQSIVDILNSRVGIPTLKFIPRGIGQTTSYGPGWTKENPTTPDQTAQNRRLIINLPNITKEIPK